jgi:hypothetical protein
MTSLVNKLKSEAKYAKNILYDFAIPQAKSELKLALSVFKHVAVPQARYLKPSQEANVSLTDCMKYSPFKTGSALFVSLSHLAGNLAISAPMMIDSNPSYSTNLIHLGVLVGINSFMGHMTMYFASNTENKCDYDKLLKGEYA